MKKEIVIFDKDGTLIDFDAFWIDVTIAAVQEVLQAIGREDADVDKILKAFGIENGVADIDGVVRKGTYEEAGFVMHEVLKEYGETRQKEEIAALLTEVYKKKAGAGKVESTCDNIKETLIKLKEEGRKILLVTADNSVFTRHCLEELGVGEYFDAIFCDDGVNPPKPDATCFLEYLKTTGFTASQVVMIGDTMTDVIFSENAGIELIGVGKTKKSRDRLKPYVKCVIPDLEAVYDAIRAVEENA